MGFLSGNVELVAIKPGQVVVDKDFLADFIDEDDCSWDHNHSCQTHGYFWIEQGEICPQEQLKRLVEWAPE